MTPVVVEAVLVAVVAAGDALVAVVVVVHHAVVVGAPVEAVLHPVEVVHQLLAAPRCPRRMFK